MEFTEDGESKKDSEEEKEERRKARKKEQGVLGAIEGNDCENMLSHGTKENICSSHNNCAVCNAFQ